MWREKQRRCEKKRQERRNGEFVVAAIACTRQGGYEGCCRGRSQMDGFRQLVALPNCSSLPAARRLAITSRSLCFTFNRVHTHSFHPVITQTMDRTFITISVGGGFCFFLQNTHRKIILNCRLFSVRNWKLSLPFSFPAFCRLDRETGANFVVRASSISITALSVRRALPPHTLFSVSIYMSYRLL